MKYNFHTHSHYDDGRLGLEDMVLGAVESGLTALGFSGHSPLPFENEWSIKKENFPEYMAEARRLKEKYSHLMDVYVGLEIDYIPGFSDDFSIFTRDAGLDYCIGSVHLVMKPGSRSTDHIWFIDGPREGYIKGIETVFGGDVRAAVEAYYGQQTQMVLTQKPHIVGHLDKVNMHNKGELFDASAGWYRKAVENLLDAIARTGSIVELNTRGMYSGKTDAFFPETWIVDACFERNIPMMVNSDAHQPDQLDRLFSEGVEILKRAGYRKTTTPFFTAAID